MDRGDPLYITKDTIIARQEAKLRNNEAFQKEFKECMDKIVKPADAGGHHVECLSSNFGHHIASYLSRKGFRTWMTIYNNDKDLIDVVNVSWMPIPSSLKSTLS